MPSYEERITADRLEIRRLTEEEKKMDYRVRRKEWMDRLRADVERSRRYRREHPMVAAGYRVTATGVFACRLYRNKKKVCSVWSLTGPDALLYIRGETREWEALPAGDGATAVRDLGTGRDVLRVTCAGPGKYRIDLMDEGFPPDGRWDVETEGDSFVFLIPIDRWTAPERFAVLERVDGTDWLPDCPGMDVEPRFRARIYNAGEELEEEILAVLAFPMLLPTPAR